MATYVKAEKGMVYFGPMVTFRDITVHFTIDKHGATVSLSDDKSGTMLTAPFDYFVEIITGQADPDNEKE